MNSVEAQVEFDSTRDAMLSRIGTMLDATAIAMEAALGRDQRLSRTIVDAILDGGEADLLAIPDDVLNEVLDEILAGVPTIDDADRRVGAVASLLTAMGSAIARSPRSHRMTFATTHEKVFGRLGHLADAKAVLERLDADTLNWMKRAVLETTNSGPLIRLG